MNVNTTAMEEFFTGMLSDSDEPNASIAMHELLDRKLGDKVIQSQQDSEDPLMRQRVHQLSSALNRQRHLEGFKDLLQDEKSTYWDVLRTINVVLDSQTSMEQLDTMLETMLGNPHPHLHTMMHVKQLMNEMTLNYDPVDDNFVVQFLPYDVMIHLNGALQTVCTLCWQICRLCHYPLELGRINGEYCLRDRSLKVILPKNEWRIVVPDPQVFKPVSKRELTVDILARIMSSAFVDQLTTAFLDAKQMLEDCKD